MKVNIPDFLLQLLNNQYGNELTNEIIESYDLKRNSSFRINNLKSNNEFIENELNKLHITYQKISWYNNAYLLSSEDAQKKITNLDIYTYGKIYFQSLSSMIPPIILNPSEKENILDMTAAPGGKTTQIASITNNKCFITACEINKIRSERLKYNLEKQGVTCAYIMNLDAKNLDDLFSFDKILLDAPCSGSGTLNTFTMDIQKVFSQKLLDKSIKAQKTLLKKAIKCLKKGGELVYSTCSILENENEEIIKEALKDNSIELVPIDFYGIEDIPKLPSKINGTLCVKPTNNYEGFFVAKLKKH